MQTLTDREQLLHAILDPANFADDGLRLAYADALREVGDDARGEFIEVQCVLVRRFGVLPDGAPIIIGGREADAEEVILRRRERELWGSYTFAPAMPPRFRGRLAMPPECKLSAEVNDGDCLVRRGFVHTVRCLLRRWHGGNACPLCQGAGTRTGWRKDTPLRKTRVKDCQDCKGTGKFRGCGKVIVRAQPLERVEVADKQPLTMSRTATARWSHDPLSTGQPPSWHLPEDVFALLPTGGGAKCCFIRDAGEHRYIYSIRDYDTKADAVNALSAALLAWARKEQP